MFSSLIFSGPKRVGISSANAEKVSKDSEAITTKDLNIKISPCYGNDGVPKRLTIY
jgi:hypothetical protein